MKLVKAAQLTGHATGIFCLEPSEAGFVFSGGGDKILARWNLASGAADKFSVNIGSAIYSIKYIPTDQWLFAGQARGGLHLLDLKTRRELRHLQLHRMQIFDIAFLAQKKLLLTCGADGVLNVLSYPDLELVRRIPVAENKLRRIAVHPDEELVVISGSDGCLRIFETDYFNEIHTLQAHELGCYGVAWHPEQPVLISGGRDAHLRFWNRNEEFKLQREIPAHNYAIYDIAFSPDGKYFATASRDKTAKIWNAADYSPVQRLDRKSGGHKNSVNALLWTDQLITAGDDAVICVWKPQNSAVTQDS